MMISVQIRTLLRFDELRHKHTDLVLKRPGSQKQEQTVVCGVKAQTIHPDVDIVVVELRHLTSSFPPS